jgi:hypothetical protein
MRATFSGAGWTHLDPPGSGVQGIGAVNQGPDLTRRRQLPEQHQAFAEKLRRPVVDRDAGAAGSQHLPAPPESGALPLAH